MPTKNTKLSRYARINMFDITKAIILAGISGFLGALVAILAEGGFPTKEDWTKVGALSVGNALSYLIKQFFTNEQGTIGKAKKPE